MIFKRPPTTPVCGHELTGRQVLVIRTLRKLGRPTMVTFIADALEDATDAELHGIFNHLNRLGGIVTKEMREFGDSKGAYWWLTDEAIAYIDAHAAD